MVRDLQASSKEASRAYWAKQTPLYEPRKDLKVIVIGAGAAGILAAYKLQRHLDNVDLKIFEKNSGVSGTWFENRYPGCACDVPAQCYTYSFEPNAHWSASYAASLEIKKYFSDFAEKYDLTKYVHTSHEVTKAIWNAETGVWEVDVLDLKTNQSVHATAHFMINATGFLNKWKYPAIDGLQDKYKGELYHSAAWPEKDLDYEGKTLALIGNGSSGIQMLPQIAPKVKKLTLIMREPTWISPPFGHEPRDFTEEEKEKFASDPEHHLKYRKDLENMMNSSFSMFHRGSETQNALEGYMTERMKSAISSEKLKKILIPTFGVGCRRLTPGANYLESLGRENVEIVTAPIVSISEKGPVTEDGTEYPVDIIACATGFDTSWRPRFPIIGTTGQELSEFWKDEPKAYLGTAVPGYPNYSVILGPGCPVGNGPVLIAMEVQMNYILEGIRRWLTENVKSFEPKLEPVLEFLEWKDSFMPNTIWADDCRSWYKGGKAGAKVQALWPGSTLHFLEVLETTRWEDYDVKYNENVNRWSFLGNGLSSVEARKGDLSWYMKNKDDTPINTILKPSARRESFSNVTPVFGI